MAKTTNPDQPTDTWIPNPSTLAKVFKGHRIELGQDGVPKETEATQDQSQGPKARDLWKEKRNQCAKVTAQR